MLVVIGLWIGGAGLVALSFESLGLACALFVLAGFLLRYAA